MDSYFITLISSLATACWQQLGKIANPLTGKLERNLDQAKISIEILNMLKEKTKGNLTPEEENFIENTIANLQINYADEVKKEETKH